MGALDPPVRAGVRRSFRAHDSDRLALPNLKAKLRSIESDLAGLRTERAELARERYDASRPSRGARLRPDLAGVSARRAGDARAVGA